MEKAKQSKFVEELKSNLQEIIFHRTKTNRYSLDNYRNKIYENRDKLPKLYRYDRANYQSVRGLETGNIKLAQASSFNDVFESMPVFEKDATMKIEKRQRGVISDIADIHYVKSFTEDDNNLLMWSHYAEGGTGFVVEYDLNKLNEEEKAGLWLINYLYPVVYSDERMDGIKIDEVIDDYVQYKKDSYDYKNDVPDPFGYHSLLECKDDLSCLSLVKSTTWEYEKEWRLSVPIVELQQQRNNYDGIVSFDCISKVICGPRIHKEIQEHIAEIVSRKNELHQHQISLISMKRDQKNFHLVGEEDYSL